jgi:hypothetical protein
MDDKFRLDRGGLALLWSKIAKILRGKQPKHNINGAVPTTSTSIFAPTSAGKSGQVLVSNGSGAPAWVNQTFGNIKGDNTWSNHCVKVTHNATTGKHVFKVWSDGNSWLQEALVLLQDGSLLTCINTAARYSWDTYRRLKAYSIDANNFIIVGEQWSYIYVQADNSVDFSVKQTTDEYMSSAICGNNIVDWANQAKQALSLSTRKIDGVSFNGTADIVHYAVCNTPNNTQTKEVTLAGFNLVAGARISVKFAVENIAQNPKLSVNGGTAKDIVFPSSNYQINAGQVIDFYYDGTNFVTTTAMYAKKATLAENCETSNKANRIAVTAESGVGAITDVDVHIVKALPSDASSYPNRIYLVV